MKLQLKNIKHFPEMSEETNAFVADLWVDGERIATCKNKGSGGMTDIMPVGPDYKAGWANIRGAEEVAKTFPPISYEGHDVEIPMILDLWVDLQVSDDLIKKQKA